MASRTAFITGVGGFVGPYLARRLLASGYEVAGLLQAGVDRNPPPSLVRMGIADQVQLFTGDLVESESLHGPLRKVAPDVIFHLAGYSEVRTSFLYPREVYRANCLGTENLLETIRTSGLDPTFVFAGSSEEYGLQFLSKDHYEAVLRDRGRVSPEPFRLPELPVDENNPMRPLSPYAVSKVYGDQLARTYHYCYGMKAIVSRAFNHEGAGRGASYVTSSIVRQCLELAKGTADHISIGNVSAFRDWSHVEDIVEGYRILGESGQPGEAYVLGAMRTTSVLAYLLFALEELDFRILSISSLDGQKALEEPLLPMRTTIFGVSVELPRVDDVQLQGRLSFDLADGGIRVRTDRGDITVRFDRERFRPADVPVLLSNTSKIAGLGYRAKKSLRDIIRDQIGSAGSELG